MIHPNSKNIASYFLFLIWPFGALLLAIKKFREPIGRTIFILGISFLGFTVTSEGDLHRYEMLFYNNQNISFLELINSYLTLQNPDIYTDLLSLFVGLFSNSHHFFFALLYAVFAYFYSGVLLNFLKLSPKKATKKLWVVFFGFALYYSIRSTISIRFYTGGLFFLYMFTTYIISKDKKYIFLTFFTPIFHFGLALTVFLGPAFLLLKKRLNLTFFLVIASFIIGQSSVISSLESLANRSEGTFIESRYNIYAADEGRERLEARYAEGYSNLNLKAKALSLFGDFLFYFCIINLFILFILKRKFVQITYLRDFFILSMLLLIEANLMLNVSNGDRYTYLFVFVFLGFCYLLFGRMLFKGIIRKLLFVTNISGLVFGIGSLYAANSLFTYQFFLFILVLVIQN